MLFKRIPLEQWKRFERILWRPPKSKGAVEKKGRPGKAGHPREGSASGIANWEGYYPEAPTSQLSHEYGKNLTGGNRRGSCNWEKSADLTVSGSESVARIFTEVEDVDFNNQIDFNLAARTNDE